MISSFMTKWSIQYEDVFHGWLEGSVSYFGYSDVTEDVETLWVRKGYGVVFGD